MANLKDINYGIGKYLEASDASDIPDIGTNRKNVDLLNFKVATNNAYALYNFKDGMIDAYMSEAGVDTSASTDETYDSSGKYYSGVAAATEGGINSNTKLLFRGGGSAGNQSFTDISASGRTISVTGNTQYSATETKSGFGATSIKFDGNGDYLSMSSSSDLYLGAPGNAWTIDYWVWHNSTQVAAQPGFQQHITYPSSSVGFTSRTNPFGIKNINGFPGIGASASSDTWIHVALVSDDASPTRSVRVYINGTQAAQVSTTYDFGTPSGNYEVGRGNRTNGGNWNYTNMVWTGYLDEYRFSQVDRTADSSDPMYISSGTSFTAPVRPYGSAYTTYNNMTLISNAQTAVTAPDTGRLMIYEETSTGSTTLDTDIKGYVSRDGGTTYTQTLLTEDTVYQEDENIKLLMHMDGANDGTVFTDSSLNGLTVTKAGTPVTKTAEKVFGTASCYLAGTTDWLKLPESDNWSFDAGQDFTVECWCKWSTAASYVGMIASKTGAGGTYNGWSLRTDSSGANRNLSFNFYDNSGSVTFACLGTSNIGDGSWHHVAATRASNTVRVFVDGTEENSGTYSGAIHGTSSGGYGLQIGMDYLDDTGSGPMHGYVDEVRIVRGVAKYTASFTEPTSAFDLSPRRLLSGSVDISGQPAGTSMRYKIETLNQSDSKICRLHGASLLWA